MMVMDDTSFWNNCRKQPHHKVYCSDYAKKSKKLVRDESFARKRESSACICSNSALMGRMMGDSKPNGYRDIMLNMIGEVKYFVRIETRPTLTIA